MNELFKKLNLKDQKEILVLNAPPSFGAELATLESVSILHSIEQVEVIDFVLAFVTHQAQVDEFAARLFPKAYGDALIWFAYPKGTSKNYTCDFNRDTGWKAVEEAGYLGVRMVAIDQDWSALRFRRKEYIKKLTRNW